MTDRDEARVRKALQGKDFPAQRNDLVTFATDRGEVDDSVLSSLAALPEGTYHDMDEVLSAVPQ